MDKKINRWLVMTASTVILLCTGAAYVFSIFVQPLSEQIGWTMPQIMLAFSINLAIGPIPTILGGYPADKGQMGWSIVIGMILSASGLYLTGMVTSLIQLYIYHGLIVGFGRGLIYSGRLSNILRLLPDKRDLTSGIITGGMGLATVFAPPIVNSLILLHDVQYAFRTIGLVYIVVVPVASISVQKTPAGYKPDGWNPPTPSV